MLMTSTLNFFDCTAAIFERRPDTAQPGALPSHRSVAGKLGREIAAVNETFHFVAFQRCKRSSDF
jgi:hypothetical protein